VFNWSGFYVGVSGGYAWGDTDVTTTRAVSINIVDPLLANNFAQPSQSDAFGAVSFGYDMMYSQRVVLGLEGDVTFGSRNATVHGVPGLVGGFLPAASAQSDRIEVDSDFSASISTRIGYLVTPQLLAYGRVGWAWQNFDVTYHCGSGAGFCGAAPATAPFSVTESHTADGFLLGAGIEWQIVKGVSARAEYRHAFLNDFDVHLGNPATRQISLNVKPNVDEFRAGVVARFSAFGMPPAPPPP
jgi:outer membrane immunogenic protein